MVRAIIFDFDGTIIDSETPVYEEWVRTYAEHGHDLPRERYVEIIGTAQHTFDPHAHLESLIGRALDRARLTAERQARHRAVIMSSGALPGVEPWIRQASEGAMALAIASSSERWWIETNLDRLGLAHHFPVIRTRESVQRAKPAPDLFLAALEGLKVAPEEAVVVEDSPNGVTAAKAAGIFTVAVPNPMTSSLDLSHADMIVPSLEQASMPDVLSEARRRRAAQAGRGAARRRRRP